VLRAFALPVLLALVALRAPPALADDIAWDGVHYLPVPVQAGSDTRLVMPEPFDDAWERDGEVSCTLLDPRTLIIRPRRAGIEQRLTLRGRSSGTLYLARVSSALPYAAIVRVQVPAARVDPVSGRSSSSIVALLKSMMQARVPAGTRVARSTRLLLDAPPYRILAEEVWSTGELTGIRARIESTTPRLPVPVVPANILIRIPQLGALRAMSADDFSLGPGHPASRAWLIYAR
jgi:hypothetical protein